MLDDSLRDTNGANQLFSISNPAFTYNGFGPKTYTLT